MYSRIQHFDNDPSLSLEVKAARADLRAKGWSYRTAALELGCSLTHLAWVLTGRRQSQRLLDAIVALPVRKA
jgi:hypothetical protein